MSRDLFLLQLPKYTDYVDTVVTKSDIGYTRNKYIARNIALLGYRTATGLYSPEEFNYRKTQAELELFPTKKAPQLFGSFLKVEDHVLLKLADCELHNQQNKLNTIIFTRHVRKSGFAVSGYIDYEQSLFEANTHAPGATDWRGVFEGTKKLIPKPTDLSFYDWHSRKVSSRDSRNWVVMDTNEDGVLFKHMSDHKTVSTNYKDKKYTANSTRTLKHSSTYGIVVFYDHYHGHRA